jgi:threonine dehydratase
VITVEDPDIIKAVLWIFSNAHLVSEPSGAAATAAVLSGAFDHAIGKRFERPIVAIVSGGNMAAEKIAEWTCR